MDVTSRTAVVVAGGDSIPSPAPELVAQLPPADLVIAADSGLDRALALGLAADVVVGDLDSVTDHALETAEAAGARIERHPAAKDAIDLELALDAARRLEAKRVVVIGGDGGRLDLFTGNLLLLASPAYADLDIEAIIGRARVYVVRGELVVTGRPGQLLTLLPVHGPAIGVTTVGLRYPLRGEELPAGTSRGCSNEFEADTARVTLEEGVLLCILPAAT
jgi:thiamine pyrophosphokinase